MFKSGFVLSTDDQLRAAMHNGTEVTVWNKGKFLDYGGQIQQVSEDAVTINDGKFLRAVSEFKVR